MTPEQLYTPSDLFPTSLKTDKRIWENLILVIKL